MPTLICHAVSKGFQASFTAEDQASRDAPTSEHGFSQRVHQLEQSLSEYKAANTQLQNALDVIDSEGSTGGAKLSRKDLRQQMEDYKSAAEQANKGRRSVSVTVNYVDTRVSSGRSAEDGQG